MSQSWKLCKRSKPEAASIFWKHSITASSATQRKAGKPYFFGTKATEAEIEFEDI